MFKLFHFFLAVFLFLAFSKAQSQVSTTEEPAYSICERTEQVQRAITQRVFKKNCSHVTKEELRNLETLSLSSYKIHSLKSQDLAELVALKELHLSYNQLTELPANIFSDLHSLEVLYLNNNKLLSLPEGIFDNLSNLKKLFLFSNQLSYLPKNFFDQLTSLEWLLLHRNQFNHANHFTHLNLSTLTFD